MAYLDGNIGVGVADLPFDVAGITLKAEERMMKGKFVIGAFILVFLALGGCAFLPELLPPEVAPPVWATTGELETGIRLTWETVVRATSYHVFRAEEENGPYTLLIQTPYISFTDEVGREHMGRWYWYKVRACNDAGCGPFSAPVRGYAGYPPAPVNVHATVPDPAGDRIVITWDPVPGATQYDVLRDRVEHGTYPTLVAQVTIPYAEDTSARPGLRYWYKVRARNTWGFGPLSEADSACLPPCVP